MQMKAWKPGKVVLAQQVSFRRGYSMILSLWTSAIISALYTPTSQVSIGLHSSSKERYTGDSPPLIENP